MSDYIKYTKRVEAFNDDIPYEVRMKYILEAYIRDKKSLEDLKNYAKGLEEENCMLTKKIKDLDSMYAESRDYEATIKKQQVEIKQLKSKLTNEFPKRVVKVKDLKKRMIRMERYIWELQALLKQNSIPYNERKVTSERSESFDIEDIDIFAVRGSKENYDITEE